MKLISDIINIFKRDRLLFLCVNAIFFGSVMAGALMAASDPSLQMLTLNTTAEGFSEGPLSGLAESYSSGNLPVAAAQTFIVNLLLGTLAVITLPSLIIPVWAPIMGIVRGLMWGMMLILPVEGIYPLSVAVPHYLTLLLEGEAYVIAIFASVRQIKALWKPGEFGTDGRLKAYLRSIVDNGKLLLVVAALLAIAAIYEACEVTYFVGTLK